MTAPAPFVERVMMDVLMGDQPQVPLAVDLCWTAAAHIEVQMILHNGEQEVAWVVSRELLADGLAVPSGDGDVRISPDPDGTFVHIALRTAPAVVLEARFDDLAFFLGRTIADTPMDAPVDVPDPDDPVWGARG